MAAIKNFIFLAISAFTIMASCNDGDTGNQVTTLENKRRVECERRAPACDGKDAMRFYQSMPVIQQNASGNITITETWTSFLVCCDDFSGIMDSLTLYNQLLDSAIRAGIPFSKTDSIGNIRIHAGFEYYDLLNNKRWETLSFGDSSFTWSMPTGEYFNTHKRELEEAHARCCLF